MTSHRHARRQGESPAAKAAAFHMAERLRDDPTSPDGPSSRPPEWTERELLNRWQVVRMLIGSIYYYSVSGFQKSQPLGIMHRAVARALDLVTQSPSHDRIANTTALIEGARRLGIRYGHRAPQNAFFQTWRARPDKRADLLPFANALGFSLAT